MAETATKLPVGKEEKADRPAEWRPFESLRREVDRLLGLPAGLLALAIRA